MILTYSEAIERVAEATYRNTQDIRQKNRQRRHQVTDLYGVEYTRQGDANAPAVFYISISPDMVYLERFQFKLIVQPFTSTVSGGTAPVTVQVDETELNIRSNAIDPNPHTHTTQAHTHNIVSGISTTPPATDGYRISIAGIDVTPYFLAQHGIWIDGEGIFPSVEIGKDYDVLRVASNLEAEGRHEDADKLTKSGYKRIEISAPGPFQITLVNYLKYPHLNR